MANKVHY